MGVAVSVGIVVFGASVSSSLRATVRAKATLGPGASQVFTVDHPVRLPAKSPLTGVTSSVTRTSEEVLVQGHEPADVLGLEPATLRALRSGTGLSLVNHWRRCSNSCGATRRAPSCRCWLQASRIG